MLEKQRAIHDFGELTYEDLDHFHSSLAATRSVTEKVRAKPYSFIFAALALGIFIGYLSRRN